MLQKSMQIHSNLISQLDAIKNTCQIAGIEVMRKEMLKIIQPGGAITLRDETQKNTDTSYTAVYFKVTLDVTIPCFSPLSLRISE